MPDAGELGRRARTPAESTTVELGRRLRPAERRIPIQGLVETTFRCNLRCQHCYVNEAPDNADASRRELDIDRLKHLIDEVAQAGCLFLTFTGGEPLLRPDFPDLHAHALRAGLLVSVFTNGTLVTERIADLFDEHRPDHVEITLYGLTPATYERVTRVPGSYNLCRAGLDRLLARGIAVRLKAMALTSNMHELAAMGRFAADHGLPFRFDGMLNPRVDCRPSCYRDLQVAPAPLAGLDAAVDGRLAEIREILETTPLTDAPQTTSVYACGAGRTTFTVDPRGRLLLCPLSRREGHDLTRGSFADGWRSVLGTLRERPWRTASPCRSCRLAMICASCPGANEMEHGDPERPVAAFCRAAHQRAFASGADLPGHRADAGCCLGAELAGAAHTGAATNAP